MLANRRSSIPPTGRTPLRRRNTIWLGRREPSPPLPPLPPLPQPSPPVFPTIRTANPLSQPIYQTGSGNSDILDLPFRPFLPEGIYLSVAIPTRNRGELEHFLGHCQQLLGTRPHRNIEHPITELEQITPL